MICRYKIKFISDIEQKIRKLLVNIAVAPFVGVWIEIYNQSGHYYGVTVAPFVGVWIEILLTAYQTALNQSLPSWECGLKFSSQSDVFQRDRVAPFVGVWIEIVYDLEDVEEVSVAPFVGVWIEIIMYNNMKYEETSLPSWECGLKYWKRSKRHRCNRVAPFVGVWIEILTEFVIL